MWGLKFSDIDFERKCIRIKRSLGRIKAPDDSEEYHWRKKNHCLNSAEKKVKTRNSFRVIKLSNYVLGEILLQRVSERKTSSGWMTPIMTSLHHLQGEWGSISQGCALQAV